MRERLNTNQFTLLYIYGSGRRGSSLLDQLRTVVPDDRHGRTHEHYDHFDSLVVPLMAGWLNKLYRYELL